ncbi:transporter substrate-binding domain-containing protein [Pseudooceanicola sp. CBS1P-1]|uniref:Transporter substrate-binding domain-containing protein n=1 Tax=Pseudooceanicola albus TaxID=2692189 RepID=A0A6L7G362_9RHOB|nr:MULTISPECIES: transporter substrate-binding domain-containing protein [Pseudooceanicola]MBT9385143.1 transporter substrate-binding domain-containing protein [Pseudooceanicola endophyticus]MXN18565.1 transporter substrate-binding domain-containing protein [Pseudooceanicola albus]
MKRLSACLAAMVALAVPAHAETLRIATDATFPPFESLDADGKLVGYDIDLMTAVCKAAALACDIQPAAWDGMIPGLMQGKYDALISQLTVTDQRRKIIAFSDIYSHPIFRFVARKDSGIDISPEGLAGKTIAVQTGTPMDKFVTAEFPKAKIKRYDSGSATYLDLTGGRADVTISYEAQIRYSFLKSPEGADYALTGPRYTGEDSPELGEGVAIALNKRDPELVKAVNAGLAKIREDGTLAALNKTYFGD